MPVRLGWPRSTVAKGPQSNESYERENPWNRTISTVLWVHKKLPQSTVKLVLPSNESYESKTGCNRTLATVLWVPLNDVTAAWRRADTVLASDCRAEFGRALTRRGWYVCVTVRLPVWPDGETMYWQAHANSPPFPLPSFRTCPIFVLQLKLFRAILFCRGAALILSYCIMWGAMGPSWSVEVVKGTSSVKHFQHLGSTRHSVLQCRDRWSHLYLLFRRKNPLLSSVLRNGSTNSKALSEIWWHLVMRSTLYSVLSLAMPVRNSTHQWEGLNLLSVPNHYELLIVFSRKYCLHIQIPCKN